MAEDNSYEKLINMKLNDEIELDTVLKDTGLVVRRVPFGWLYIFIKTDYDHGTFLQRTMTTTFVPRSI